MRRPTWDRYFLKIARAVAVRADCRRARFGAVIVGADHRIIGTGYNGSPPGGPSCLNGQCPRGLKTPEEIAHGTPDYSDCVAIHAETNAVLYATRETKGTTIYIAGGHPPCDMCAKLIMAAGITRTVWE